MKKQMLMALGIIIVFVASSIGPAAASEAGNSGIASESGDFETDAWYVFGIYGYIDVLHLNTNAGGWLNGYDYVSGVNHPLLGKYEGGKAYFAVDGLDTYYTLIFYVITIATRDGYIYRITDGMDIVGPEYVWLTTTSSQSEEGISVFDEATGACAQVTPQAWYYFGVMPWTSCYCWISTSYSPWLYGYDATYTDDLVLGYSEKGKFYFAWDFNEGDWYYELMFMAGTISSRSGYAQRTVDGMSYDYDDFWLT